MTWEPAAPAGVCRWLTRAEARAGLGVRDAAGGLRSKRTEGRWTGRESCPGEECWRHRAQKRLGLDTRAHRK